MNVLLTGGMGYIGSHTAVVLLRAGHHVVLYDNLSNSSDQVLGKLAQITTQPIPFVQGDVRDTELLKATLVGHHIDAVIHFAGLKAVGESVEKPVEYYANNVQGTISLLQAMQSVHIKTLVFSSSAAVYGQTQYLPLDESHPTSATNPYGRSKLHIEEMLKDVAASDPAWRMACLRYFNPVGGSREWPDWREPQWRALRRSGGLRVTAMFECFWWRLPYGRRYGREGLHPCHGPGRGPRGRIELSV